MCVFLIHYSTVMQIFVGGLDRNATNKYLRQVFGSFGEIVYVKIPVGKVCGFVQFTNSFVLYDLWVEFHGSGSLLLVA